MKSYWISQEDLNRWVEALARSYQVFGPIEKKHGQFIDWGQIEDPTDLRLEECGQPKSSIKTFYLPQPETLFRFSARPRDPEAFRLKEPEENGHRRVLFGVRPCDARSVFLNSLAYKEDTYFNARLDKNLLIGIACQQHSNTCFCTWVGGSPFGTDGLDVLLVEMEDNYLAKAVTERGQALLKMADGAKEAAEEDEKGLMELKERAERAMKAMPDTAQSLKAKDLMALYNAPFWQSLCEPCINCGACTFLCPTCYCFDIQDEVIRGKGRRIRYWDSCMFPLFTLHASGHNPRGQKLQRVRNRFMHKLKYFPDRFGPISCVGCGRCIRECPVNIDIREVLRDLLAVG